MRTTILPRMRKLIPALLIAATLAGAAWYWTQRAVPIELLRPPVPPATWQAYRRAVDEAQPVPADALVAAVVQTNRAEVAAGADPRSSPAFLAASNGVRMQAWQFVQRTSPEAYMQLGRQRGLALIDALEALLKWSADSDTSITDALSMPTPPPVVQTYIDLGGGFVRFAQDAGFIVDGTLQGVPFIQALFLRHWMAPLTQSMPLDAFVTRDERTWHLRWKVEAQAKGSLASRMAAADELRAVAGYPADLNAAALLYHAGRVDEARARLTQASGPTAKAWLRTLADARPAQ